MLGGLARTGRAARGRRIGRRRWHLWSVLSVAALSIFVLVAIFQMANLYVEGLGLTGPGHRLAHGGYRSGRRGRRTRPDRSASTPA